MPAPTSLHPSGLGRRRAHESGRESDDDRQTPFKRQFGGGIAYLGAALLGVWLLQAMLGPLLPQSAEIPYSEFKTKLAAGQIVDVTLGPQIDGVMKNPAPKSPAGGDQPVRHARAAEWRPRPAQGTRAPRT